MNWRKYFQETNGEGYLATAGQRGEVNIAPYFRPEVLDDGTLAFAMSDSLSYHNVQENPRATFAFNEGSHKGVRLYLEKTQEQDDGLLLEKLRRRADAEVHPGLSAHLTHLVAFKVGRFEPLTRV